MNFGAVLCLDWGHHPPDLVSCEESNIPNHVSCEESYMPELSRHPKPRETTYHLVTVILPCRTHQLKELFRIYCIDDKLI